MTVRIYIILMNILGFGAIGLDKLKARHHKWRIPEKTLFLISILGGSAGSWLGMYTFHHKTKHISFVAGIPLIFIIQIVLAFAFM